jgi:hypothetical protein
MMRHTGRAIRCGAPIAALVLGACAATGPGAGSDGLHTLVFNESLELRPGSARVTIQAGRTTDRSLVAKFQTWCQVRVAGSADSPAVDRIRPGRFDVVAQRTWREARNVEPVRLAGPWIGPVAESVGGPVARLRMYTELRLSSEEQTGVQRLVCARDGDWHDRPPSLEEIAATLEPLATLAGNAG